MIELPEPFKRGDTFRLPFEVLDASGNEVNVSTWSFVSQLKDYAGALIQNFTVQKLGLGQCLIEVVPLTTAAWPIKILVMDIRVLDALGGVYSTVDIQVKVQKANSE